MSAYAMFPCGPMPVLKGKAKSSVGSDNIFNSNHAVSLLEQPNQTWSKKKLSPRPIRPCKSPTTSSETVRNDLPEITALAVQSEKVASVSVEGVVKEMLHEHEPNILSTENISGESSVSLERSQVEENLQTEGNIQFKPENSVRTVNPDELNDEATANSEDYGIAVKSAKVDRRKFIERFISRSKKFISGAQASIDAGVMIDEEIEYDLSITFNGRTYARKKSFRRIVQLRNALVKELHNIRQKKSRRSGVIRIVFESDVGNNQVEKQLSEIPELPAGMGADADAAASNLGIAGLSLHMLQSLLTCKYCPAMEVWLKSISLLVTPDTSPSLKQFLDEGNTDTVKDNSGKRIFARRPKRTLFRRLSSISEDSPLDEKKIEELDTDPCDVTYVSDMDEDDNDYDYDNFSECDAYDNCS